MTEYCIALNLRNGKGRSSSSASYKRLSRARGGVLPSNVLRELAGVALCDGSRYGVLFSGPDVSAERRSLAFFLCCRPHFF